MSETFTFRRAEASDVDAVFSLMQSVKAGMEHQEWYITDSKEYIEAHLEKQGIVIIAESRKGELAGYFMVDFPSIRLMNSEDLQNDNLGKDLLFDEENLRLVAHMDSAAVNPKYRGYHLQSQMLREAERELADYPQKHYLCTVHPDNQASLTTMLRGGYMIVKTKEKYGGLSRHVLYKKKEIVRPKVLVSACLLGIKCRYNETGELNSELVSMMKDAELIPVCPETIGGLPTPRVPAERKGNQVITRDGADVTKEYQKGAEISLHFAKLYGCRCAVLKERSPSCGSGRIYNGTHSRTLTDGDGVTAALLKKHGIVVFGESQIKECRRFLGF